MELKRHAKFREILAGAYFGFLVIYLAIFVIIGLKPAEAVQPEIVAELTVPSIGLASGVTEMSLNNHELETPDTLVGSFARAQNKTLLVGHSSTVFRELDKIQIGDEVAYDETIYKVVEIEVMARDEVNMNEILMGTEQNTLVLMTCAGTDLGDGDATHRLIITAVEG